MTKSNYIGGGGRANVPVRNPVRATKATALLGKLSPNATLGGISRATGLDLATVSRTLNGKRRPTWETMTRIADHLKVTVDQLRMAIQ